MIGKNINQRHDTLAVSVQHQSEIYVFVKNEGLGQALNSILVFVGIRHSPQRFSLPNFIHVSYLFLSYKSGLGIANKRYLLFRYFDDLRPAIPIISLAKLISFAVLPVSLKAMYFFLYFGNSDDFFRHKDVELYQSYNYSSCQLSIALKFINLEHTLHYFQRSLSNFPNLYGRFRLFYNFFENFIHLFKSLTNVGMRKGTELLDTQAKIIFPESYRRWGLSNKFKAFFSYLFVVGLSLEQQAQQYNSKTFVEWV